MTSSKMSASSTSSERVDTDNIRVTQTGQLAANGSFQFVDIRDLGTIDSLQITVK